MDVDAFRALLTDDGQAVLAAVCGSDPATWPATLTALRRDHSAELVTAAIEQVRLRQEAEAKFGADARRMYFTRDGLERASHREVAEYKLGRVLDEIGVVFLDVFHLGIGADALALGSVHAVTAVDSDPLNVAVTTANAEALDALSLTWIQQQELTAYRPWGEAVFIDLLQRASPDGSHVGDGGDGAQICVPSLPWALDTVRGMGQGAIRLSPELPYGRLPEGCGADEAEWISWAGEVQEAVLWWWYGEMNPAVRVPRRATLLPGGATLTGRGLPAPAVRPPGRYLYEVDAAVVRAGLVAEVAEDVDGGVLDGAVPACVTSDEAYATPFATAFEIIEVLPYGPSGPGALLRDRGVGELTVRQYGCAAEAAELSRAFAPSGTGAATVFLTRVAGEPTLLLVRPTGAPRTAAGVLAVEDPDQSV
ncbi:SAM-dependent methyltransferase [Streptomyces yangpuensis]|uniref:THUMP-like domain-containing protein n=1 Tax=Streptomyces yangpuensis TaxID=1648182 RepID=UPI0037F64572